MQIKWVSHLLNFFDKIKSGQQFRELQRYTLYNSIIFTYFYMHLQQRED